MTRRLSVAPDHEPGVPPITRRRTVADALQALAEIAGAGDPFDLHAGDITVSSDPIEAVFVVTIASDGQPTAAVWGIHNAGLTHEQLEQLHDDAAEAISTLRWKGIAQVHERWRNRERSRVLYAAHQAEQQERAARLFPFLCDCGDRFATSRGLAQHQSRSRLHRDRRLTP